MLTLLANKSRCLIREFTTQDGFSILYGTQQNQDMGRSFRSRDVQQFIKIGVGPSLALSHFTVEVLIAS